MGKASSKSAWIGSVVAHAVLLGIAFLGYRSLRSSDAQQLSGLVNTKFSHDYGEVELRFDEPRRPKVVPPSPKQVVETPVVPAPRLDPVETFPARQVGSLPAVPGVAHPPSGGSALSPPGPVTPNRGKGSPLHTSVKAGKSIVYVMDCSASMGRGSKLKEACASLMASLEQLSPEVEFQVVLYHSFAEKMSVGGSTDLVLATLENKRAVQEQLAKLTAEGTSKHDEGLKKALLLKPSAIFLLTDADDLTEAQLITVGLLNRSRTVIYPILFGQKERLTKSSLLDRLAQANGGAVIARD